MMEENRDKIIRAIGEHRLREAFSCCRSMTGTYGLACNERLDELEIVYRQLLSFFVQGANDNERRRVIDYIGANLLNIADTIVEEQLTHDSGALYYSRKRYRMGFPFPSVSDVLSDLAQAESGSDRKAYDRHVERLFDVVWTCDQLRDEEIGALEKLPSSFLQAVVVSAAGLALQQRWRASLARFLCVITASPRASDEVVARAAVGLVSAINAWPQHAASDTPMLNPILAAAAEQRPIGNIFFTVYGRIIAALKTEEITRRMQTDIIAGLKAIQPEEMEKLQSISDLSDPTDPGNSPEWLEHLQQSELGEKLRSLSELQEQGADVMHATFMNLKGDVFFREISNWFLPFDPAHSRLSGSSAGSTSLGELIKAIHPQLCDSDCYSLLLSMEMMPESMRTQALATMGLDSEGSGNRSGEAGQPETLTTPEKRFFLPIKRYVECLYRFYKVFRYHTDFRDIFTSPPGVNLPLLSTYTTDRAGRLHLADDLLRQNYLDEALPLIVRMGEEQAEASLFEKQGFILRRKGRYAEALSAYRKAEILSRGRKALWPLKQVAFCLRRLGRTREAYPVLMQCYELCPEDKRLLTSAADCLIELGQYDEALGLYKRFSDEGGSFDTRSRRPLAWVYFLTGAYDKAAGIYADLCIAQDAAPADFLNAGHTQAVQRNYLQAQQAYIKAIDRYPGNLIDFRKAYGTDLPVLLRAGMQEEEIFLLAESVDMQYEQRS